ncbi:MAG TPA: OsmC family protein [Gaiellaceae bacterium]|nr:OsmC family protein [Gaiellaceae bacterium]
MSITKDYRFQVTVDWLRDRLTKATADGKPDLEVATPPEFRGGIPNVWSPEELLTASAASCFAVTFAAIAERRHVPLLGLHVTGVAHITRRDDGRLGFVAIELTAAVSTDAELVLEAERAARDAERACLVAAALDVPVHVDVAVHATPLEIVW